MSKRLHLLAKFEKGSLALGYILASPVILGYPYFRCLPSTILSHCIGKFVSGICHLTQCRQQPQAGSERFKMPTPSQSTYTLVSPPTPGLDPPPGVIPTFHQPYTLRPYAELTIALGVIITTCLVMARIFVKARVVRKFLWEDYTCIVEWVSLHVFVLAPCECEHQFGTRDEGLPVKLKMLIITVTSSRLWWQNVITTMMTKRHHD